jgi:hypothetical protein
MKRLNQSGSHVLVAMLFVLVVGVVGLIGYRVMHNNDQSVSSSAGQPRAAATVPSTIKNNADLTNVSKVLDTSSSQLDGSLNDNSLNNDLNDLL